MLPIPRGVMRLVCEKQNYFGFSKSLKFRSRRSCMVENLSQSSFFAKTLYNQKVRLTHSFNAFLNSGDS